MKQYKHHQQGAALVLAVVIALILFLMGFMLFALSSSLLKLDKSRRSQLENKVSMHQAFRDAVSNQAFQYNQNTVPVSSSGSTGFTNGTYDFEITNNHIDDNANQRFNSFIVPENGYTMRTIDYYLDLTLGSRQKHIVIRVPSNTQRSSSTSINKSTISLNVPAINWGALSATQLDSVSRDFDQDERMVGHVAAVEINNQTLTLRDTAGSTLGNPLDLSGQLTAGSYALSQGWRLVDGAWWLSIGVYNTGNTTEGCVIEAPLESFLTDISTLTCVSLGNNVVVIEGARYPDPTGFPLCVEGDSYSQGDICQEDGILFRANRNNAIGLPFSTNRPGRWRVYYPNSDWIAPYTQGARYNTGDLVAYDDIVFRSTKNGQSRDPFSNNSWRVNGVYAWNSDVRYLTGDIVTFNGVFYQANRTVNRVSTIPPSFARWTDIGSTLEQEEIDKLPAEAQANVTVGSTPGDYQPINIVFPYREEDPSQTQLNCEGGYPPINTATFNQCIDGEIYNTGDTCYENNMLFTAQYYTTDSPFNAPAAWRLDMPTSNDLTWVAPYSNNVQYDINTRVIYDGRRFINLSYTNSGITPYESNSWAIDGVYEWNAGIQYRGGEIVIRDGNFYLANYWNKGVDPLTNSGNSGDEWTNLGSVYNNQTTEEALNSCGIINNGSGSDILSQGPETVSANAAALVSPSGEEYSNLFDDDSATKFLSYSSSIPAIQMQYSAPVYVSNIELTSANDRDIYPGRDPSSIYLYGINSVGNPEFISSVIVPGFTENYQDQTIPIERSGNNGLYSTYEVEFRTTQPGTTGGGVCSNGCVQLSELAFS